MPPVTGPGRVFLEGPVIDLQGLHLGPLRAPLGRLLHAPRQVKQASEASIGGASRAGGARGGDVAEVNRAQRAAVVAAYFVAFWVALPAGLWWAGRALDRAAGWDRQVVWWGLVPLAAGAPLLAWAVHQLRHEGGGLPIGALPPPHLASRGPYAWVRHPIYEGFVLTLLGAALLIGSPGFAGVVLPAFAAAVAAYAWVEERLLLRRFGAAYRAYRRWAGMALPRLPRLLWALGRAGLIPVRAEGREHLPASGPGDPGGQPHLLPGPHLPDRRPGPADPLPHHRRGVPSPPRPLVHGPHGAICVRRYRPDPLAAAAVIDALAAGEVVGFFPERERSVTGAYQGPTPLWPPSPPASACRWCRWASTAATSLAPAGPIPCAAARCWSVSARRWTSPAAIRRRPSTPPSGACSTTIPSLSTWTGCPGIAWAGCSGNAPPVARRTAGVPPTWPAPAAAAAWRPAPDGLLDGPGGPTTLGALALTQRAGPRLPIEVEATAERERSIWGPRSPSSH